MSLPSHRKEGSFRQSTKAFQANSRISVASGTSHVDQSFYHLAPPRNTWAEGDVGDPLGLTLIHGGPGSQVDLIFVHGLGGSSLKTWSWKRNVDLFWPEWIRHEEGLSDCRVFSFGYNSKFWDSGEPFSIMDFSKGLLIHMSQYSRGNGDQIGRVSRLDEAEPSGVSSHAPTACITARLHAADNFPRNR